MGFKKNEVNQLLAATSRKCCICGKQHDVQVHHILPKEKGGSDNIENAIPLCPACHDRVHVRPSHGRTTRDYTPDELRLHRDKMIADSRFDKEYLRNSDEPNSQIFACDSSAVPDSIRISRLLISTLAKNDCKHLQILETDVRSFVKGEATRHPLMFQGQFSSIPLVFGDYVMILSWNGTNARVERVLSRKEAYPMNDDWAVCLGLYRKATLLPYRTQARRLLTSSDAKLALAVFRKLIDQTEHYLRQIEKQPVKQTRVGIDMDQFLNEAEFALVSADMGTAVARMEAVLSTVHKLLIHYAPESAGYREGATPVSPEAPPAARGKKTVLIVEDDPTNRWILREVLQREGFQCVEASCSREALLLLVEKDFDLIITDLMMPNKDGLNNSIDGRELVLAAKKSGAKAKIIVLTGFPKMALRASAGTERFPCDFFMMKPWKIDELIGIVRNLLKMKKKNAREAPI